MQAVDLRQVRDQIGACPLALPVKELHVFKSRLWTVEAYQISKVLGDHKAGMAKDIREQASSTQLYVQVAVLF